MPGETKTPLVAATVPADAGSATASEFALFGGGYLPIMTGPGAEIIVTQTPATSPPQPFQATGLSLGGAQSWMYVWDFRDLSNQSNH